MVNSEDCKLIQIEISRGHYSIRRGICGAKKKQRFVDINKKFILTGLTLMLYTSW